MGAPSTAQSLDLIQAEPLQKVLCGPRYSELFKFPGLEQLKSMIVLVDCGWTLAAKRQHDKDADGDRQND